jgi:opacity protein-like surface antigen
MKKIVSTSLIACSFLLTANAYSADGLYISADAGLAILSDADATDPSQPGITATMGYDAGVSFLAALGYKMQNFRCEGEIGYQINDFDKQSAFGMDLDLAGDQTALSFLANVYYDIPTNSRFTPFITAGVGVVKVDINDLRYPASTWQEPYNDDDTVLAGQLGAGVAFAMNDYFSIDLKYRFFMADDLEFSDNSTLDGPLSHNFYFGLRYTF